MDIDSITFEHVRIDNHGLLCMYAMGVAIVSSLALDVLARNRRRMFVEELLAIGANDRRNRKFCRIFLVVVYIHTVPRNKKSTRVT